MEPIMTQDVYVDLLFLINFSMDYLCLYICAKVLHRKAKLPKMLAASAIGGIYSVVSLFIPHLPVIELVIDVSVCLIMCAIVFADKGRRLSSTLLCSFLFVGISMMTGGCMTAIFNLLNRLDLPLDKIDGDGISTYMFAILALIAGVISLRSGQLISHRADVRECRLNLTIGKKSLEITALSDSGNLVKDPISGKAVVLIDRSELSKVADIKIFDEFANGIICESSYIRGLRLIPINTAAGKSFLCAAIPKKLTAEITTRKNKTFTREIDALIAPSDIKSSAIGCKAIIPAEILKDN